MGEGSKKRTGARPEGRGMIVVLVILVLSSTGVWECRWRGIAIGHGQIFRSSSRVSPSIAQQTRWTEKGKQDFQGPPLLNKQNGNKV